MSARMTVYCPPLDSDNESDEDTSHSLHQNISKGLCHLSDTESSDEQHPIPQSSLCNSKYKDFRYACVPRHKLYFNDLDIDSVSFSMRRTKLDTQRTKPVSSNMNKAKNLSHDVRNKSEAVSSTTRIDSGRSSARVNRASSMVGSYLFIDINIKYYIIII